MLNESEKLSGDMINQEDFKKMMLDLEESNEKQAKYAKKQYRMSQLTALTSVIILVAVLYTCTVTIPRVNRIFNDMEVVMTDINTITSDLASANLSQLITNVDHLVTSSEESVQKALEQVNSIDINTLNQAIRDLSSLINPIARFFGK